MSVMLPRQLELAWAEAGDERRLQATTEARVTLSNLVAYPRLTERHLQDVTMLAASFLRFASIPAAGAPNLMSEEQVTEVTNRIARTATGYSEGCFTAQETLSAIIIQLHEAGVKL